MHKQCIAAVATAAAQTCMSMARMVRGGDLLGGLEQSELFVQLDRRNQCIPLTYGHGSKKSGRKGFPGTGIKGAAIRTQLEHPQEGSDASGFLPTSDHTKTLPSACGCPQADV